MYGALDISVSGMIAQRTRLESIAANQANWQSYSRDAEGNPVPYQSRRVLFAPGDPTARTAAGRRGGVHVAQIQINNAPPSLRYDPSNPFAYQTGERKGYVPVSDINPVLESINAMEAARSYEANIAAAEVTKSMMAQSLRLLA
ncbi:MAG: flagellar basal body rod protein FlgC [Phycisphaerales bacterium]|nr:flagellar basal body rod protein FlgC [Phycisphaerales bacterium]